MAKRAWMSIAVVVGCLGAAGAAYADAPVGGAAGSGNWGAQGAQAGVKLRPGAVGEAGKRLFELADADQDNQIDRIEALDTATFLIKGLVLAADQNSNGRIDPSESLGLRERLQQLPMASALLAQAGADDRGHFDLIARLVDSSKLAPISQEQLLDAAGRVISGLYARADRDGDNLLAPREIHAAVAAAVLADRDVLAVFRAADLDRDGLLNAREAAQVMPVALSDASFRGADANSDGKLTLEEARTMMRLGLREVGIREDAGQTTAPAATQAPAGQGRQGQGQQAAPPNRGRTPAGD